MQRPTTLVLNSSPNPSYPDEVVIFTAQVTPEFAHKFGSEFVDGNVGFNIDDGPNTVEVPLINGVATYSYTFSAAGAHGCGAQYRGSDNFQASSSVGHGQTVV